MRTLKSAYSAVLPQQRERVAALLKQHGETVISTVTVSQVFQGMRDVVALPCDTSSVPAERGLIIRGKPIFELTGQEPEAVFWLMVTGELPTPEELSGLQEDLRIRGRRIPSHVWRSIEVFPRHGHPMRALSQAVLALGESQSSDSEVGGSRLRDGLAKVTKTDRWELMLEDSLNLIACLPAVAAYLYRLRFGRGHRSGVGHRLDPLESGTWSENFAHLLGVGGEAFQDAIRRYCVLQCDHEGGNASAFTNLVVTSTHADIYGSASAAFNALAGPLHGLAAQECLEWVQGVHRTFGGVPSSAQLDAYVEDQLKSGKVIPGYGHAVLRCVDPRFLAMIETGEKICADNALFQIVKLAYEVVPVVLARLGRAKNPRPNTDAVPGSLWTALGMPEKDFYTVLFAVSRVLGLCAQAVHYQALMLPILRPKSITLAELEARFASDPVPASANT